MSCDSNAVFATIIENLQVYSLITRRNASLEAHAIYRPVIVGGEVTRQFPSFNLQVASNFQDGGPSYVGIVDSTLTEDNPPTVRAVDLNLEFRSGLVVGSFPSWFDWSTIEALALTMVSSTTVYQGNTYTVVVIDQDGYATDPELTFSDGMVLIDQQTYRYSQHGYQSDNEGRLTLYVLTGSTPVRLVDSRLGRQFGPSVLAPFAEISVQSSTGFVDGFIVADSYMDNVTDSITVQLHGDFYQGNYSCQDLFPTRAPSPVFKFGADPVVITPSGKKTMFWLPLGEYRSVLKTPTGDELFIRCFGKPGGRSQWIDAVKLVKHGTPVAELVLVRGDGLGKANHDLVGPSETRPKLDFVKATLDADTRVYLVNADYAATGGATLHLAKHDFPILDTEGDELILATDAFKLKLFTMPARKFADLNEAAKYSHFDFQFLQLRRRQECTGILADLMFGTHSLDPALLNSYLTKPKTPNPLDCY